MDLSFIGTVEVKERVERDVYFTFAGKRLNAKNLLELLDEVSGGSVEVTDRELGELLVKEGVLSSLGSRRWYMGASEGPNFGAFRAAVYELVEKHG